MNKRRMATIRAKVVEQAKTTPKCMAQNGKKILMQRKKTYKARAEEAALSQKHQEARKLEEEKFKIYEKWKELGILRKK